MSTYGWQLVVDWRALGADERELLIGELWCLPISGIEERDVDVIVGFDAEAEARSAAAALTVPSKVIEVIDDAYLDEWRHFARPWQVEKLFVRPSWVDAVPPQPSALKGRSGRLSALKGRSGRLSALKGRSGRLSALKGRSGRDTIEIVIDPQRTFGSGAHASTRLALALMQHLDLRNAVVLDLGCGSGVLAIAAAALGAARIDAIDVDADAVAATIDNARRNGVEDRIDARVATIDDVTDDFDVVVANVLPSVHRVIAQGVRRVARRHVILAGMLDAHVAEVESAYRATRVAARREDGWTAVALRVDRGGLAP